MTRILKAAHYRARQFFAALHPSITPEDWLLVTSVLQQNPSALSLFQRMPRSDQQHAIAVLQTLHQQGHTHPALQQAALLHDVGKALGQPLVYRVLVVLLKSLWPAALAKLSNAPLDSPAWQRPFVVNAHHPQIGADWARNAGCDALTVTLIKMHRQLPANHNTTLLETLHRQLYKADNRN